MGEETNHQSPSGCLGLVVLVSVLGVFTWVGTGGCSPTKPPVPQSAKTPSSEDIRKQPERQAFIDSMVVRGIILRTEKPGQVPRVFVGRSFDLLPFDQKQSFFGVVFAYHQTADPDVKFLALYDGFSGREIGTFDGRLGLRLK